MLPVKDIMLKNVITVNEETPIYTAIEKMVNNSISGMPVVDKGCKLVGVISEWDVLQLLTEKTIEDKATVQQYMTREVVSFKENDSAIEICDFLKNSYKRRAPIVNDDNVVVGIVSRHDIIRLVLSLRKGNSRASG